MNKRGRESAVRAGRFEDVGALMTTREAAARMRLSPYTVTVLALRGELASVKVGSAPGRRGGRRLFPVSEVEGWLSRRLRYE